MNELSKDFEVIIKSFLKSISPSEIFKEKVLINKNQIKIEDKTFPLNEFEKIYVIGFGKASSAMATEIEKYLLDKIEDGIVITKYGFKTETKKIKVFEAGHPLPDENSIKYSLDVLNLLSKTKENDLVICLISGGGSSLFEVPVDGIDLITLQELNDYLIKRKIPIHRINSFRKAFSKVKGGKLLEYIYPSTCLSFVISDVIGDDLSVIASGPTYLAAKKIYIDNKDTLEVEKILHHKDEVIKIEQLIKSQSFPEEIISYYNSKVHNFIVASNKTAVERSIEISKQLGYEIFACKYDLLMSVEELASHFINEFLSLNQTQGYFKKIIVYGCETFLEVKGSGKGGRNLHLLLTILNELIKNKIKPNFNFFISSFATDGNDGNTDSAGAFINNQILEKVKLSTFSPEVYLQNFDSYNFFKNFNCLINTGPTFTNVADLFICLACSTEKQS